ncbi:MAG: glycoside hydrolase family 19 protein [Brevinema sp.]
MLKNKTTVWFLITMFFFTACSLQTLNVDSGVEAYQADVVYQRGAVVSDSGGTYRALTTVRGTDPSDYVATASAPRNPWARVAQSESTGVLSQVAQTVPLWDAQSIYLADAPVQRGGQYYKSFWWNQNTDPSEIENQNNVTVDGVTHWGPWLPITREQAEALLGSSGNNNGGGTVVDPTPTPTPDPDPSTPEIGTNVPPTNVDSEISQKYAWNSTAVYLENNVAVFNNQYFRAKWWTQGNEPNATPAQPWDTPWEVITEARFLALLSGTPPPTTIPPTGNEGGNTGGNTGGGSTETPTEPTTPPSEAYAFLYANGYIQEWDWNDSNLPENLKEPIAKVKSSTAASTAKSFFTSHLSKAQWEQLFPRRRGTAAWTAESGQSAPDYYSYENFSAALELLGNYVYFIEVALDPSTGAETFFERNYVLNRTTGKLRLIKQNEDYFAADASWLLNRPYKVKVVDYNAFGTEGSNNDKIRAIAGFLAHASHETSGSWATAPGFAFTPSLFPSAQFPSYIGNTLPGELAWSLYFNEEVAFSGATSSHYENTYDKIFPPTKGQSYHGRGAFQLSWNYNYGLASAIFFGTSRVLLDDPNMIIKGGTASGTWLSSRVEGGTLAFLTSLMFWLTPQGTKPSQQDTMILNRDDGRYVAGTAKLVTAPGLGTPGYGWTINIMNGGYEANKSWEEGKPNYDAKVARRVKHYIFFTQALGGNNDGEVLDTYGNHSY